MYFQVGLVSVYGHRMQDRGLEKKRLRTLNLLTYAMSDPGSGLNKKHNTVLINVQREHPKSTLVPRPRCKG
jgi:hypothetical protein